jgi:ribosomal protein S12 methylthiotransferase
MSLRFSIVTLGCDKNTVDSERYAAELTARGASPAGSLEDADLILVNTCGFIDAAKAESVEALVEAGRFKSGGACRAVVALGCMVERYAGELREALPEVDVFLGASETERLVPALQERGLLTHDPVAQHPGVRLYTGELPHIRYLKISEGCDHGCAFCAIPLMRGRHRSFAAADVVREAQLLEMQGAREINLVAQDLAHYGRDRRDGTALPELLEALLSETGVPWYRLLYIYSAGITPRLLELMAAEPRLLRYLDIPMQHASDPVLARMRRPERKEKQRDKISRLREAIPGVAIRTTVIVGFPGETEDDVVQLLEFLEDVQFDRVGVFTYSPQEGTRAFELPDDVPEEVKRERQERVVEHQRLVTGERYEAMIGTTVRAIVDRAAAGSAPTQARIEGQADDIDGVTWLTESLAPGTIANVRLEGVVDDYDFRASVVGSVLEPRPTAPSRPRALPMAPSTVSSYGR